MSGLRGVILDVDGTLVNSNDAHTRAWVEAFKRHGFNGSFEQVRPLIGMGSDKLIPALIGLEKESEQGQQIAQVRRQIFKTRYLPTLEAFPAVPALLARLQANGLKLGVASSAEQEERANFLRLPGRRRLFSKKHPLLWSEGGNLE